MIIKFISLLLITSNALAQIVFFDVNNNPKEKRDAIAAAKKKGERIVVYPAGDELFDKTQVEIILKKEKPQTIFLSGHDGGGDISGDRNERLEMSELKSILDRNKDVAENIQVLGLLGCNTGSQALIMKWKKMMPNLRFVAGYDGTAPSDKWTQGRNYLVDIINKKDEILAIRESDIVKEKFTEFRHMENMLEASLYLSMPTCNLDDPYQEFIFRPKRQVPEERFKRFNNKECPQKREEYNDNLEKLYSTYHDGKKPIPKNTSKSDLKDLHTFVSQNEHCFDGFSSDGYPSPNNVLFLRYFNHLIKNFGAYYENELDVFFKELSQYESKKSIKNMADKTIVKIKKEQERIDEVSDWYSDYEKTLKHLLEEAQLTNNLTKIKRIKDELELDSDSPNYQRLKELNKKYSKRVKLIRNLKKKSRTTSTKSYKKLKINSISDLKTMSRKELKTFAHNLHGINFGLSTNPIFMKKMRRTIQRVLYELDDTMIPFNWHDANLGQPINIRDPAYTATEIQKDLEKDSESIPNFNADDYFKFLDQK